MSLTRIFLVLISSLFIVVSVRAVEFPVFTNSIQDAIIEGDSSNKDVLVIFTAKWCGNCIIMKSDLDKNKEVLEDIVYCYVDIDDNPDLKEEYKVRSIPDYMILRKRKEIKRKVGYSNLKTFKRWLKDATK